MAKRGQVLKTGELDERIVFVSCVPGRFTYGNTESCRERSGTRWKRVVPHRGRGSCVGGTICVIICLVPLLLGLRC